MNAGRFKDREEAGILLSEKLAGFNDTNSVVVGIPRGGVSVASVIANKLSLPLEVMPVRSMKHPADRTKSIGAVTAEDVFIHDCPRTVPREYIARQIASLRNAIRRESDFYYGDEAPDPFLFKDVILVGDTCSSVDTIMASMASIKRQSPSKIIVAVPVLTPEAERIIRAEVDEVAYLELEHATSRPDDLFVESAGVTEDRVRELLVGSRKPKRNLNMKRKLSIV